MIYEVRFKKSARKEINKLVPEQARRIFSAIEKLSHQPRKGAVRKMVGSSYWRLRAGDYRVVYDIQDKAVIIEIIRVRHRKEAYKSR